MPVVSWGKRIEDYEILNLLQRCSYMKVYRAKCRLNSLVEVQIRMIKKRLVSKSVADAIKQEIAVYSRLRHPAIVEFFTSFEDAEKIYVVLELPPNNDLLNYVSSKGSLSEELGGHILKQIVDGLLYLEKNQIFSRDLILKNVILTRDLQVKLVHFGLTISTKQVDEKPCPLWGSPYYISSEAVPGILHNSESDTWNLGYILYTLLDGKYPFEANAAKGSLTKVLIDDYVIPAHISHPAKNLIIKLLKGYGINSLKLQDILMHPFMNSLNKQRMFHEPMNNDFTVTNTDSGFGRTMSTEQQQVNSRFADKKRKTPLLPNYYTPISNPPNALRETHSSRNMKHDTCMDSNSILSGTFPCSGNKPLSEREQNRNDDRKVSQRSQRKENAVSKGIGEEAKSKLQVPPLNSKRLQPTRHRTKNAILTILTNGEVCIEFIKKKHSTERISEVCRISQDGLRIVLYKPTKHSEIGDQPPPLPEGGADSIYSYENLPACHHRKYLYAARFVQLVKAKTPKITMYTSRSKCYYMENGPQSDCEVNFYDEVKVTRVNGVVKVAEKTNDLIYLESDVPPNLEEYVEHYTYCYQRCLLLESTLTSLETATGHSYFPIIIGRKPASVKKNTPQREKENIRPPVYSPPAMSSFHATCSIISTTKPSRSVNLENINATKVTVPGIGVATEFPNQIIRIDFEDGSILTMIPESSGGGVIYNSVNGSVMEYSAKSDIPDVVREKLRYVPIVINYLAKDKHKIIR